MIEKCNFKRTLKEDICSDLIKTRVLIKKGVYCRLSGINQSDCKGEENCVVFQTYKLLTLIATDYCQRIEDVRKNLIEKGLLNEEKNE